MVSSVLDLFPRLRPRAGQFPEEARSQVQGHRLLSLLGAGLVVGFAPLYATASPDGVDPLWVRLGTGGSMLALFALSYRSVRVRAAYVSCVWSVVNIVMGWFTVIAVLNQFSGEYTMGLLLVYAVLAGTLDVETEPEEGTCVTVVFPRTETANGTPSSERR